MLVRTRMAPSPTGGYHIGHIRTLLYNWAFAKKHNGKFIIRIEDTDRNRYVEGSIDKILDVIQDYGFSWDEGPRVGGKYAPYIQSERLSLYKKHVDILIQKGFAYHCFCSEERLKELRKKQRSQGLPTTKYDRHCLKLSKKEIDHLIKQEKPYVIRLKVPENTNITFKDKVYGEVTVNSDSLDDQVLLKSDGFPTYHLAVVVDDHFMEVTHILRGNDWIPSTPKRILLYNAFGWKPPVFIHLPNLKELGENRKLSKRFGSVFAIEFLQEGYLAEAVINFLMLLGWNPGTEKEIYCLDEFVKEFSLDRIHKTDLVSFDREKLLWFNGYYLRNISTKDLWEKIVAWADKFDIKLLAHTIKDCDVSHHVKVVALVQERIKVLSEFNDLTHYFYKDPKVDKELLVKYTKDPARTVRIIEDFINNFDKIQPWKLEVLEKNSHALIEKKGYKPKESFMTIRVATTGEKATPPLFDLLEILGKDVVLRRLKKAKTL